MIIKNIPKLLKLQLDKLIPVPGKTGIDWFLYCYFLSYFKNEHFLEFGVGEGGSLYTMLAFSDKVTAVDSWNYNWNKQPITDTLYTFNKTVSFIDKETSDLLLTDLDHYKFVHLDANKGFENTFSDLSIASEVCNGIICIDDYMNSMWPEVTWAVDEFLKTHKNWKIVLVGNHQIFISNIKINMRELILNFPLVLRNDIFYLTYGQLPNEIKDFCNSEYITYSWYSKAWDNALVV